MKIVLRCPSSSDLFPHSGEPFCSLPFFRRPFLLLRWLSGHHHFSGDLSDRQPHHLKNLSPIYKELFTALWTNHRRSLTHIIKTRQTTSALDTFPARAASVLALLPATRSPTMNDPNPIVSPSSELFCVLLWWFFVFLFHSSPLSGEQSRKDALPLFGRFPNAFSSKLTFDHCHQSPKTTTSSTCTATPTISACNPMKSPSVWSSRTRRMTHLQPASHWSSLPPPKRHLW